MTYQIPLDNELIVDNFAGGGGASCGIELALDRPVNIAINHDPQALGMHETNHPLTEHHCENVWDINPREVCKGRRVALAWFSPDCKHFSKAKGGKPVEKKIRGLAWVVLRWAATVKPRVICLENVEEFTTWGPLTPDGMPDKAQKGRTFNSFINALRKQGYIVEWRELRACDYGAPTIRKRLFLIARCDGLSILWPKPTHGPGLKPHRTAAECIDWSIPCPSIFERSRPLAENTMRRIAKGIQRFVIDCNNPFIIKVNHSYDQFRGQELHEPLDTITSKNGYALVQPFLTEHANASNPRVFAADEPLRTQCAMVKGGHFALVSPVIAGVGGRAGQSRPRGGDEPLATVTAKGDTALCSAVLVGAGGPYYAGEPKPVDKPYHTLTTRNHSQLVTAFLAQHNTQRTGYNPGRPADEPLATIVSRGTQTQLVTSHMMKMRGTNVGDSTDAPLHTVSAGGTHHAEVRAFLLKYYGSGDGKEPHELTKPIGTVTSKDRFGLVTVHGEEYQIVDIGMRMLTPRELYRAQGFPDSYIIDRLSDGSPLNKTAQVRMCGNSVCPPLAEAIVRANVRQSLLWSEAA